MEILVQNIVGHFVKIYFIDREMKKNAMAKILIRSEFVYTMLIQFWGRRPHFGSANFSKSQSQRSVIYIMYIILYTLIWIVYRNIDKNGNMP